MKRQIILILAAASLSACNSEPDPNFQKSVEDRQAAQAGDPYDALSRPPRLYSYSNADQMQRQVVATSSAAQLAATVASMSEKLEKDKDLLGKATTNAQCQAAFKASLEFQAGSDAKDVASHRAAEIFSELVKCRDASIKREESGGDDEGVANVERRLASNAMVLVGSSLASKGDTKNGLKIWREGDALVVKDKPSFKLEVKSLRGW